MSHLKRGKSSQRTELNYSSSKYTDLPQGHKSLLGKRRLQSTWTSRIFHRQNSFLGSSTEKGDKEESLWQQLPLVASDILLICVPLILEDVRRGISGKLCHKCPFFLKNKEFAKYLGVVVGELKCHQGTEREVSVEKYWKVCCNRGSFMLQLAPSFSNLTLQSHKLNWGAQKVLHSIE